MSNLLASQNIIRAACLFSSSYWVEVRNCAQVDFSDLLEGSTARWNVDSSNILKDSTLDWNFSYNMFKERWCGRNPFEVWRVDEKLGVGVVKSFTRNYITTWVSTLKNYWSISESSWNLNLFKFYKYPVHSNRI